MNTLGRPVGRRLPVVASYFPPVGGGGVARTLQRIRDRGLGWVVDPASSEAFISCLENLRRRVHSGQPPPRPGAEVRASLCALATMLRLISTLERVAGLGAIP